MRTRAIPQQLDRERTGRMHLPRATNGSRWRSPPLATLIVFAMCVVCASGAAAQSADHDHHGLPAESAVADPQATHNDPGGVFLMQQSSGTSTQPASWPMPMLMIDRGAWRFGLMGQAFVVYAQQSGPRGADGAFAVNWMMGSASRSLGSGRVQFRAMASLEPATVRHRNYPLLFQTGETAYGEPLVDGQHPHDFLMELSAQYVQAFGRVGMLDAYYAPVGDPAVGPVAFPHRASALELPQATLGHHWQDSTHIASNVLTVGWARGPVRVESSAFHGTEPDEARWNLDIGSMNSWSLRTSVAPRPDWMGQVSWARLHQPEALHDDNVDRTTASIHHITPRSDGRALATSVIWATNRKSVERTRTHAVVVEALTPLWSRHSVSTRFEWSQRDELFANDHGLARRLQELTGKTAFQVTALTVGYTRDLLVGGGVGVGVGGTLTRYWADSALSPYYGARPVGATVFLRVRVMPSPTAPMTHH